MGTHTRPSPERFNPRAIIGELNEKQAIDLMREIRRRFNWTGVEFMPGDLDAVLAESHPGLSDTQRRTVVQRVLGTRMWQVLFTKRLSTLGEDYMTLMLSATGVEGGESDA